MAFESYAQYYDLIYREKNFLEEVKYIEKLGRFTKGISILDLGCGTGGHDLPLASLGYQVTGVDLSEGMVSQAIHKAKEAGIQATFVHGDIRTIRLGKTFDAVLSMFAVMGYQTGNADFLNALTTARQHLKQGGLFIFDVWYGPAVLRQVPETRVKEIPLNTERILRIAVPEMNSLMNTVTVNYTILKFSGDRLLDETREAHPMRYFFAPEIELFADRTGFKVEHVCPFMEAERTPTDRDWNVSWVLRAV